MGIGTVLSKFVSGVLTPGFPSHKTVVQLILLKLLSVGALRVLKVNSAPHFGTMSELETMKPFPSSKMYKEILGKQILNANTLQSHIDVLDWRKMSCQSHSRIGDLVVCSRDVVCNAYWSLH